MSVRLSVQKMLSIPVVVSKIVTNKSCLVCVYSKKYAICAPLRPKSDCCHRGKAEVCIFYFKTTWSDFQKASQTVTEHGKLSNVYSISKPLGQSSRSLVRLLPREAKPSYVYLILKSLGQSSKIPIKPLPPKEKPSYIHTIFKKTPPPQSRFQTVVCVSTPRMYPLYILNPWFMLIHPAKVQLKYFQFHLIFSQHTVLPIIIESR